MTMFTPTSPSHKKGINNKHKSNTSTVSITSFQTSKHKVKCVTLAPYSTSQLVTVEGKIATYKVKYKEMIQHDKDTEEKELVTGFNIPFDEKRGNTTFLDFPWFSAIESSQKLDTLVKTINSNSQPTTTSQTVQHKKVGKVPQGLLLPTILPIKTTLTLLLRTLLL